MIFLITLILTVFSGLNPNFSQAKESAGKWFLGWLWRIVILFIPIFIVVYLYLPAIVGPLLLSYVWWIFIVFFGLNCIITGLSQAGEHDFFILPEGYGVFVLFITLLIGMLLIGSPIFRAMEYRGLLGKVEEYNFTEETRPIDIKHLREVSKEQAVKLGARVLGEADSFIGSMFKPGDYSIQRIAGELYWVAPLEFQGLWKWLKVRKTPGFIMVSAEDRTRKPELCTSFDGEEFEFYYMPSACFGQKLRRHLFNNGYWNYILTDFTMEITDDFEPKWVVTAMLPTIMFYGEDVEGIIVVDPKTGEDEFYKNGEIPEWIDRVYPEETIESRITYWGKYISGFLNTIFAETDIVKPAPYGGKAVPDVWFVWGDDNQPYWETGLTSPRTTDQSMVGFIMVNSRTGKAKFFKESGVSEDGAIDSVSASLGAEAERWRGTQPILYNVYGEPTWVIPIISKKENLFVELALVWVKNSQVVRAESKSEALRKYRELLVASGREEVPGEQLGIMEVTGEVDIISAVVREGNTVYFLTIKSIPGKIFIGSIKTSAKFPFVEKNDLVHFTFLQTQEGVVQIEKFDLSRMKLVEAPIQTEFKEMREETNERLERAKALRSIQKQIENMDPEKLIELFRKMAEMEIELGIKQLEK